MTKRQAIMPQEGARRDALGNACFYLHIAVVLFIALGWLVPVRALLIFYLVLLPAVALQWQFNADSCVLNNVESLIRTGRWRDPGNAEEGAFLLALVHRRFGPGITHGQMNRVIYLAMAIFWALGLGHLLGA